jgi:hypothetical protein
MSQFLGKIHYWLYHKIQLAEAAEKKIMEAAAQAGLPVSGFEQESDSLFEAPLPSASLDSLIDQQNIHGWLQHRIGQAESRQAFYVTRILNHSPQLKESLTEIYREQAREAAAMTAAAPATPESMLQSIHDYLLEGMPCDRAQQVVQNTGSLLSWRYDPCLHQAYWESVDGDVSHYYDFRQAWISQYVDELQPTWHYSLSDEGVHEIKREGSAA